VGLHEPRRALVVEFGQRAGLQDRGGALLAGQSAFRVSRHHLIHLHHEVGRVQPVLPQLVQPLRRHRDGLGAGIVGIGRRRTVRGEAFREGEVRNVMDVFQIRTVFDVESSFSERILSHEALTEAPSNHEGKDYGRLEAFDPSRRYCSRTP